MLLLLIRDADQDGKDTNIEAEFAAKQSKYFLGSAGYLRTAFDSITQVHLHPDPSQEDVPVDYLPKCWQGPDGSVVPK